MSGDRKAFFWIAGFVVFAVLLYALSSILAPFVAGLAVAYFFDPVADRLEKAGVSRGLAAGLVILAFLALAVAILLLLTPLLQGQIVGLVATVPDLVEVLRERVRPLLELLSENLSSGEIDNLKVAAESFAGDILAWLGGLLRGLWSGGMAFFNVVSLVVITPLVAFYLLRDWDKIVAQFDHLLPRHSIDTFHEQFKAIDSTIAAFVRGQASVCLVLAVYYGTGLSLAGLDFGLLVGLGTGLLAFIPYVGASIGLLTGVGIALAQFSDWQSVLMIAAIFIAGQTAESYILTPKLVGGRVGLHPIWIIFALLAGGALFGLTGVLLAVPATAVIGVLIRFGVAQYLESPLYDGGKASHD
ncbi:MAG: AI-2E family transporter [Rhodospirillales bacterium]|nr:AI-2E family transporter [Rhodospirillales bacterium]